MLRRISIILLVVIYVSVTLIALPSFASANQSSSSNGITLCGVSIKNHISIDGKIDISFCISHRQQLKVKSVYYSYTVNGSKIDIRLHLNKTEIQNYSIVKNGTKVNITEVHEWWSAYNITQPSRNDVGALIVQLDGGSTTISVPNGYIPEFSSSTTEIRQDTFTGLPLVIIAVIAVAIAILKIVI